MNPIKLCCIFFLALVAYRLQAQEIRTSLENFFSEVRKGGYPKIPGVLTDTEDPGAVLTMLAPFLKDSADAVRASACEIAFSVSSRSSRIPARSQAVNILLNAYHDRDPANVSRVVDLLTRFEKTDFVFPAADSVRKFIQRQDDPFDRLMKLGAFLGLTDLIPEIRPYSQPGNRTQVRWAALLSLARLGDPTALEDIMNRVRKLPLNDDLVYRIFPDLIFTRQQKPVDFVVSALQSDDRNCLSADTERETAIPCGYRIMEQLAPVIEGYPLSLLESGDLETNDYTVALKNVRQWFQKNKDYTLRTDRY